MANGLARLLEHDHPLFSYNMAQLEQAAGNDGIDTRLLADVTEKAHEVMRTIGLDVQNTRAEELYHALNALVGQGKVEEVLADAKYVLINPEDEVVSFNPEDVVENTHHELDFANRETESGKRNLRAEIIRRYIESDRTDNSLVKRLTAEAGLAPERDEGHVEIAPNQEARPRILAIGDIITDAFIKLDENYAEVTTDDKGYKRLSFELGAKLPYDSVEIVEAVECSPNAAVSMTRLGLDVSLMSWLGDDEPGKSMVRYLKAQGVGTDDLVVETGMKSNYHYVLRYGADRTKLQKFEDYSYQWKSPEKAPDWLYLGVLGEKTWPLHEAMLEYLQSNPSVKLVFQPGMYHLMWGAEKVKPFYERAEIVILNREEAAQVTGKDRGDVGVLLQAFHDLGVKVIVITDGADGAYASDGEHKFFMPNYPDPKPPLDRTGAGDAFASTIAATLALGESLETALKWAPINSMNVVQQMGAQAGLQTRAQIEEWLGKAPDNYQVTDI